MASPPQHEEEEPRSSPAPPFAAAVSKVAAAQICLSVGYRAADPAALRSLSDIATRYIAAVARSAAAAAAARGRTDSNLLDLVRGMEALALPRGFTGASDPARPLLQSRLLRELMAFAESVDEVPFARPIRRRREAEEASVTFAQAGKDPPLQHVPRWLPCFPESRAERKEERTEKRWEECIIAQEEGLREAPAAIGGGRPSAAAGGILQSKEKVRFKLGSGTRRCVNKKRKRVLPLSWNCGEDDEVNKEEKDGGEGGRRSVMEERTAKDEEVNKEEKDGGGGAQRSVMEERPAAALRQRRRRRTVSGC